LGYCERERLAYKASGGAYTLPLCAGIHYHLQAEHCSVSHSQSTWLPLTVRYEVLSSCPVLDMSTMCKRNRRCWHWGASRGSQNAGSTSSKSHRCDEGADNSSAWFAKTELEGQKACTLHLCAGIDHHLQAEHYSIMHSVIHHVSPPPPHCQGCVAE